MDKIERAILRECRVMSKTHNRVVGMRRLSTNECAIMYLDTNEPSRIDEDGYETAAPKGKWNPRVMLVVKRNWVELAVTLLEKKGTRNDND